MFRSATRLSAFSVLAASSAFAQTAAGPWQGTLQLPNNGRSIRIRIDVEGSGTSLTAKVYSIDQAPAPMAASAVSFAGGEFRFSVPSIGGSYVGKLSPDGQTAVGTLTQGGAAMPLELKHMTAETAWPLPAAVQPEKPMDTKADPSFEVATIKPTAPDEKRKMLTLQGTRLVVVNMGLMDLLTFAFDVQAKQIVGAPAWVSTEMFDVEARPDVEGQPSIVQMKSMIRKLAAERFGFRFEDGKREMSVYTLTVSKQGSKLTRSLSKDAHPGLFFRGALGRLAVSNASMDDFSNFLQSVVLDRPVANQTALEGRWDFLLNWTPDESQFGGHVPPAPAPVEGVEPPPGLFTAMPEQDGLRLDPGKAPVRVLQVTAVQKPSAN